MLDYYIIAIVCINLTSIDATSMIFYTRGVEVYNFMGFMNKGSGRFLCIFLIVADT